MAKISVDEIKSLVSDRRLFTLPCIRNKRRTMIIMNLSMTLASLLI